MCVQIHLTSPKPSKFGTIILFILQMGLQKPREAKVVAQYNTANQYQRSSHLSHHSPNAQV